VSQINFSDDEQRLFKLISGAASELGYPCYLIGGYVRDRLLERTSKDIDIVCVGHGIDLARATASKFEPPLHTAVFKNFGTAKLKPDPEHDVLQGYDIEFVGARKESYDRGSRKPVVENGTLQEDLDRRDFTINTLAISLNGDDFGSLLDTFDGIKDLEAGIIRTPLDPHKAFSDDPLRMIRAIRFAATLGFTIDNPTLMAIKEMKDRIEIVSQERITDELNKMIMADTPSIGFELLFDTGLLAIIFPEMTELYGVETRDNIGHKDNFYHTLKVLDNLCEVSDDLWLRWSAILHDIAKPPTKRFEKGHGWTFHGHEVVGSRMVPKIFKRLKLPLNDKMKFVQKMVMLHLRPISLTSKQVTDSGVRRLLFDAGDDTDKLMQLAEADITSKDDRKVQRYLKNFKIVREKMIEVEEKDRIRNWQPPISGEEIMKIFDLSPSREVGVLKNEIKNAILDGVIGNDYDEAYDLLVSKAKELGIKPSQKK
jgi:tRNA nucleotidyltransferase/poly(A) polymerase